jgi:hypothetical protein
MDFRSDQACPRRKFRRTIGLPGVSAGQPVTAAASHRMCASQSGLALAARAERIALTRDRVVPIVRE